MLGKRLNEIRKTLKLTQEEISTQTGISYRAYTSYEREDRNPSLEFLDILVKKYNVNLNWLISGVGNKFNSQISSEIDYEFEQKVINVIKKYGFVQK